MDAVLHAAFAEAMARLGPFEPAPMLAAAVSGGADSLALAVLARDWAADRGGAVTALVVDHGLRAESASEAAQTLARLTRLGIPARLLTLRGLARGPGLAARARVARHAALATACAGDGILHLLLGHHAGDQAETLLMRRRSGSGARGLAGMAALAEGEHLRLLRPLLAVPPGRLRALLRAAGIGWVDDPSNRDLATLRARLRMELADPDGCGPDVAALVREAAKHGHRRAAQDEAIAAELARAVRLQPEGWAVLAAGAALSPAALAALLRIIAGRPYPAASEAVARLAGQKRAATLAGARLLPAGRFGAPGDWLVVREATGMAPPVAARAGAVWDGRFRLSATAAPPPGATLGALGPDAAPLRHGFLRRTHREWAWPDVVLRTLPALRLDGDVVAVPHLGYPDAASCCKDSLDFTPPQPMAGATFVPAVSEVITHSGDAEADGGARTV